MKALAACVLAAAGSVASAQPMQVQLSLRFVEVIAGSNEPVALSDGILQPGEAARLELTVAFSPPVGTQVSYTPPPPPGTGQVAGLGFICLNINGDPTAQGTWSFFSRAPGFPYGWTGDPTLSSLENVVLAQFPLPGQTANSANPIDPILRAVWAPAHYHPRTVTFSTGAVPAGCEGGVSGMLVRYGTDPGTGDPLYLIVNYVPTIQTSVQIPITGGCYPNCDDSTSPPILNVSDFICFLNRYAAKSPYANCDGSTAWPYLSVADFTCFTNCYAVGCP